MRLAIPEPGCMPHHETVTGKQIQPIIEVKKI